MKAKDVPPLHAALADLSPYFPIFYDAFESSTDHAKGYFEGLGTTHDPWLQAHIMRHYVKLFLQRRDVGGRRISAREFGYERFAILYQVLVYPHA